MIINCSSYWTQALYTLVGPTVTRPVHDPLAVTHLENWLHKIIEKGNLSNTKKIKKVFTKFNCNNKPLSAIPCNEILVC